AGMVRSTLVLWDACKKSSTARCGSSRSRTRRRSLRSQKNQQALVSYARPSDYEFTSISGQARLIDDPDQVRALWSEGLKVWFTHGPDSPDIALLAIDVEVTRTWTKPASVLTYAYYYLRARITGRSPSPSQIAKQEIIRT